MRDQNQAVVEPEMTRRAFLGLLGVAAVTIVARPQLAAARGSAFRARAHGGVELPALRRPRKRHGN